ncbi:DUF1059 domain-containing protein [Candidatus Kaiserbacteria bacterium]|nr:DUF1059 domain-containing protein [Candidatus Kaiserbacteria bacterium]
MKKIKCYDCDLQFESETREDVLNQLYAHYMKDHNEIITGVSEEEKKIWMDKFEKDWSEAEDV